MLKVIKYGLAICIIVFIGDRLVSFGLSKIFQRNVHGQSGGDLNYYLNYAPKADFVIIGNSRAYRHFDPDSLSDNGYNLSHNGMHLPFHAGVVALLDGWKKMPDTLLLQVEPSSFVFFKEDDIDSDEVSYLNNYYNKSEYIKSQINDISKYERVKYFFSSYQFNGKVPGLLKSLLSSKNINATRNGFSPLKYNASDSLRLNKQLIRLEAVNKELNKALEDYKMERSIKAKVILEHIVELCKTNNTHLIVVVSPNYTTPTESISEAGRYIASYLDRGQAEYFNFIDDSLPELNGKEYWRDFEHLNDEGAKILSSHLKSKLKENR